MVLASKLNKSIKIIHGKGSVIFAAPLDKNTAKVGGLVKVDNFPPLRWKVC